MSIQPNVWSKTKDVKNIENEDEKKDEYKPDKRIAKIFEAKERYAREMRQEKFLRWLEVYNE